MLRLLALLQALALGITVADSTAAELDNGTAIEACISCHAAGTLAPVGNVGSPLDAHYVDLNPAGPRSEYGPRQLHVDPLSVDVTGTSLAVVYDVTDETGAGVTELFPQDGRLTVARLVPRTDLVEDDPAWQALIRGERFTTGGAVWQNLGGGRYSYVSAFDPTSVPVNAGDTLRVAIQISASDLPAGNGWCDFDADLGSANACPGTPSLTREIVTTDTCNGCHGVTTDVKLSFHGGGRTEVEYCVTCHDPGIGETEMTPMTHKIHYGVNLTQGFRDWSDVHFTKDVDNCTACHTGGGADELNWSMVPTRVACGSCHDDVDFDTGEGHGSGGAQLVDTFCGNCHPPQGPITEALRPVETVHQGVAREMEAGRYRGDGNGYTFGDVSYDGETDELTIDYAVVRDGVKMDLETDPAWANGGSLNFQIGWSTEEIRNQGSGSSPAPAQPVRVSARDFGGVVTHLGGGDYRAVIPKPEEASGVLAVMLEGRPVADLLGDGNFSRLPVQAQIANVSVERRLGATPRRAIVDIAKCNSCHDHGGAGLSFHGTNRTLATTSCGVCHNGDATDIRQRPANPGDAPDGKREESIDFKRIVHGIHSGVDLAQGLVLYGFRGSVHDYSEVRFIGNNENCLSCHLPGTYSTEDAWETTSSTIDTGLEITETEDDLRISRVAAVCSSCHDDDRAQHHMLLGGASFMALEKDILMAPEPTSRMLALAALATVTLLGGRHRRRQRG